LFGFDTFGKHSERLESMTRRRNTVHDLAALRLHPDGSRVHTIERQSKCVAKDPRGNLIALDAGGSGTVKKRRRVPHSDDEQEKIDIDNIGSASEQEGHDLDSGNKSKQKGIGESPVKFVKDPRAKKRQKFYEDIEFVDRTKPRDWNAEGSSVVPSSVGDPCTSLQIRFLFKGNTGPLKMYSSFCG
jgi:hypothetical protein